MAAWMDRRCCSRRPCHKPTYHTRQHHHYATAPASPAALQSNSLSPVVPAGTTTTTTATAHTATAAVAPLRHQGSTIRAGSDSNNSSSSVRAVT